MKKKITILVIIGILIVAIVTLSIILIRNGGLEKEEPMSEELKKAKEKFDIRLNIHKNEYYIYGIKPLANFDNYTIEIPDAIDNIPVTEIHDEIDFSRFQDHNIKIIRLGKNIRYIIGDVTGNNDEDNPYGENIFLNANTLVSIEVSNENQTFTSVEGVLFSKDKSVLIKYPNGRTATDETSSHSYTIPSGVKQIYNHAFYYNATLESIIFSDGVEKVGKESFASCSKLSYVQFSDSVVEIENRAFASCTSLKSIDLPYGVTKLSRGVFSKCINLTNIYLPSTLSNESCFEDEAFSGCVNIKKIYTEESNLIFVREIIKKYPVFKDLTDQELEQLVVERK
jgi:putative cell wall binding repeat-containing protein